MDKLKPCPFCGGKARIIAFDPFDGYQGRCTVYKVGCTKCFASINDPDEDKAIEAWNRRVSIGDFEEEIDLGQVLKEAIVAGEKAVNHVKEIITYLEKQQ